MNRIDFNGWVGRGQDDIMVNGPEIMIRQKRTGKRIKIKFEVMKSVGPGLARPPEERNIFDVEEDEYNILKALAQALQDIGLIPGDANSAELKATKYHLEDMRSLVHKDRLQNTKT